MRIFLAFCLIIVLWSTTPLAIKWSGEGPGFLFGVAARMVIGLVCLLPFVLFTRQKFPFDRKACLTYLAVALQIYGAMLSVYWAAQFIPSGWISVIFGLTPMLTALMSAIWLNERSLGFLQLISYALGLSGLFVMFGTALDISRDAAMGIGGVTLASFLQSASSVLVKRIGA
ncbi:MAG TPA: EamA family transporter, partial [Methylococcaceae bacterium]|nr:EamA family transporter [Methylococcaceae bacterium]